MHNLPTVQRFWVKVSLSTQQFKYPEFPSFPDDGRVQDVGITFAIWAHKYTLTQRLASAGLTRVHSVIPGKIYIRPVVHVVRWLLGVQASKLNGKGVVRLMSQMVEQVVMSSSGIVVPEYMIEH